MRSRKVLLAGLVLCVISHAQAILAHSQKTFRVRGKIVDSHTNAIVGAEVKFEGSNATETVSSDSRGLYHAELPVGLYRMTVAKGSSGYGRHFTRPLFRVSSRKTIVLNVTLYPPLPDCDPGAIIERRPDGTTKSETTITPDNLRDECGGEDRLPVPSDSGVSFELLFRYSSRVRRDGERVYSGRSQNPVLVAFNLFTLAADHVTYDLNNRTILATGNVTTANGFGGSAHGGSMKFRIDKDRTLRLQ